jgi:hypothetical protein
MSNPKFQFDRVYNNSPTDLTDSGIVFDEYYVNDILTVEYQKFYFDDRPQFICTKTRKYWNVDP